MITFIALTLSLLVVAAGMFLLARAKKEDLGKLFSFSSYTLVILGLLLFIAGKTINLKRQTNKSKPLKTWVMISSTGWVKVLNGARINIMFIHQKILKNGPKSVATLSVITTWDGLMVMNGISNDGRSGTNPMYIPAGQDLSNNIANSTR